MRRRWNEADFDRLTEIKYYLFALRNVIKSKKLPIVIDTEEETKEIADLADWVTEMMKNRPTQRKPLADYLINLAALAFGGATMWFLWQIFQTIRVWVETAD